MGGFCNEQRIFVWHELLHVFFGASPLRFRGEHWGFLVCKFFVALDSGVQKGAGCKRTERLAIAPGFLVADEVFRLRRVGCSSMRAHTYPCGFQPQPPDLVRGRAATVTVDTHGVSGGAVPLGAVSISAVLVQLGYTVPTERLPGGLRRELLHCYKRSGRVLVSEVELEN